MMSKTSDFSNCGETISLTFGDCGENHVGMEKVGALVKKGDGFTLTDFETYKGIFEKLGCESIIYDLKEQLSGIDTSILGTIENAYVLVIRGGLEKFLRMDGFSMEDI